MAVAGSSFYLHMSEGGSEGPSLEVAERRLEPASVWFATLCLIYALHHQYMQDDGSTLSAGWIGFCWQRAVKSGPGSTASSGPPPRTACGMLPVGFYTYFVPCWNVSRSHIVKVITNSWIGPMGLWSLVTIPGKGNRLSSRNP